MFRELLSVFKTDDAVSRMGEGFEEMLEHVRDLTVSAGIYFFDAPPTEAQLLELKKQDVKVNKLERKIRKQIIAHISVNPSGADAVYALILMSLVKDAERMGDYAKNLAEVYDAGCGPLPPEGDEVADALRNVRSRTEGLVKELPIAFSNWDAAEAADLIEAGVEVTGMADGLISKVAAGSYDTAVALTLALGARFYKRITAHLLNILSGIVMPVHKLDYYDEDVTSRLLEGRGDDDEDNGDNGAG